jgi:hypothetical protein
MNTTIWKFELQVIDHQIVNMPAFAEILTVQMQHDKVCLWARVNPDADREVRIIEIYGTGHAFASVSRQRRYIATFQMHSGDFHAFENTSFPYQ